MGLLKSVLKWSALSLFSIYNTIKADEVINQVCVNSFESLKINQPYKIVNPLNSKDTLDLKLISSNRMNQLYGEPLWGCSLYDTIHVSTGAGHKEINSIGEYVGKHAPKIAVHEIGHRSTPSKLTFYSYKNYGLATTLNLLETSNPQSSFLDKKINKILERSRLEIQVEEAKAISFELDNYEKYNPELVKQSASHYLFFKFRDHEVGNIMALYLQYKLGSFKEAHKFISESSVDEMKSTLLNLYDINEQEKFNNHLKKKFNIYIILGHQRDPRNRNKFDTEKELVADYFVKKFIPINVLVEDYSSKDLIQDFNYLVQNNSNFFEESYRNKTTTTGEKEHFKEILNTFK